MEVFNGVSLIISALSIVLGILTKYAIDYLKTDKSLQSDETKAQFAELKLERDELRERTRTHLDVLEAQISRLQEQVNSLQQTNLDIVRENVQLHFEVKLLRERVAQLESSSAELK